MHKIEMMVGAFIDYWPALSEGPVREKFALISEATQDVPASGSMSGLSSPGHANVFSAGEDGVFAANGETLDFDWLWYMPGQITHSQSLRDVMTGPMSGCYLFRYIVTEQKVSMVNHVGTDSRPEHRNTKAVKALWRAYNDTGTISAVKGFNPLAGVRAEMTAPQEDIGLTRTQFRKCWALMTAAGGNYAIVVQRYDCPTAEGTTTLTRIEAVTPMTLESWEAIKGGAFKPPEVEEEAAASTSTSGLV